MKVLVTGGCGFIGRYLVEELADAGLDVRIYDALNDQESLTKKAEFIHGDIFDLHMFRQAFRNIDYVIHLVGVRDAHIAEADPDKSFRLNVLSLHNVLEACRINGIKRVLFPSSASVYGRTDKIPVSEEDPVHPTGIYAYHKWLCEELVRAYRSTYGLQYIIFRLFNAYGKGNKNIIHHCISAFKEREHLTVFGADQFRDFVFIGDVARAFRLAIVNDGVESRTINIGAGKAWTIRSIVQQIQKILPGLEVRFEDKEGFVPFHSVADCTLARTLLGFDATNSESFFEKVVREMANGA